MWRLQLLVISVCVLLSGCLNVYSNISVFHELPPNVSGMTYATLPFKDQEGSLEHKSYEQEVKLELNAKGLKETQLDQAQVIIFMSYGIDTGKQVISSYPIIGQTGVSSSTTSGTIYSYGNYGTYSGTTTYNPTYGVVGSGVASQTVYTRFLRIEILDKQALVKKEIKKLYEATVVSSGRSPQLSAVLPTMIKALFEEFPGKNGGYQNGSTSNPPMKKFYSICKFF